MYERSYKAKVLASRQAPQKKKRKRRFPLRKALWALAGAVALAGVVILIRLPGLRVREIEVEGTIVADPQEVSLFVGSQIEGTVLRVFPKSSMLLVPTATIGKKLLKQFPRFAAADVRRKGVRGLSVSVVEREGAFLWCRVQDDCFFMTDEGIVFAQAPFFSGDAYEKIFYGEQAELPFSPLPGGLLELVHTLRDRLPTIGIVPTQYRIVSDHQIDIVFSHYGSEATLMIDQTNDIDKTLEDLATGLATDPLKEQFHNEKKVLEYLDARFANKIVYKFQ